MLCHISRILLLGIIDSFLESAAADGHYIVKAHAESLQL